MKRHPRFPLSHCRFAKTSQTIFVDSNPVSESGAPITLYLSGSYQIYINDSGSPNHFYK